MTSLETQQKLTSLQKSIESRVTNGLGVNRDTNFAPKGFENYVSLEIRLGEMNRVTQKPDVKEQVDLNYFKSWREKLESAAADNIIDIRSAKGVMQGLDRFRQRRSDERRTPATIPDIHPDTLRLRKVVGYLRTSGLAAATFIVGSISAVLWDAHTAERSTLIDQSLATRSQLENYKQEYEEAETPEEKTTILELSIPTAIEYSEARKRLNSIDEWDTLGTAAGGITLMAVSLTTAGLAMGTFVEFKNARRVPKPKRNRRLF